LIGGVAVGISETLFAAMVSPAYRDVFIFSILVLFLLFRPGGIFNAQVTEKI
jgi:branched-chain amino acid transport system permease protein